jgi:hypothetical protein
VSLLMNIPLAQCGLTKLNPSLWKRELRTLDTLAQAMSQLQFDKIGSLQFNNGTDSIEIGPCYEWDEP